jgi:hypothetical protein
MPDHYEAEVNRGDLNVDHFTRQLNNRWERGWRLARLFEQSGNTVIVWERRAAQKARERLGGRMRRS